VPAGWLTGPVQRRDGRLPGGRHHGGDRCAVNAAAHDGSAYHRCADDSSAVDPGADDRAADHRGALADAQPVSLSISVDVTIGHAVTG
jgi:hypothetical protein